MGASRTEGRGMTATEECECRIRGVPAGLGEPVFDKLDAESPTPCSHRRGDGHRNRRGFRARTVGSEPSIPWDASAPFQHCGGFSAAVPRRGDPLPYRRQAHLPIAKPREPWTRRGASARSGTRAATTSAFPRIVQSWKPWRRRREDIAAQAALHHRERPLGSLCAQKKPAGKPSRPVCWRSAKRISSSEKSLFAARSWGTPSFGNGSKGFRFHAVVGIAFSRVVE